MPKQKNHIFTLLTGGKYPVVDNVVGTILSAAILAGASILFGYGFGLANYNIGFQEYLHSSRWVLTGELFTLWAAVIVLSLYILSKLILDMRRPNRERYTSDEFFNLIWRWQPSGSSDENPYDLEAYCPADDTCITWRNESYTNVRFGICTHCGFKTLSGLELDRDFKERVRLAIGKNLRSGDWKTAGKRVAQYRKLVAAELETAKQEANKKKRSKA